MRSTFVIILWLSCTLAAFAADPSLKEREWIIDGVARKALVHVPASATKTETPLVFVFHGHDGTMASASRTFRIHTLWPEAMAVYLQGLDTPSRGDPKGKEPGWQQGAGDEGDRDLKLFDAVLKSLKAEYKINDRRIYATGFSNGGGFTYLLWANRGHELAAVGAIGSIVGPHMKLEPKPVIHIAGETDTRAKYEWQKQTMEEIREVNHCASEGTSWAKVGALVGTKYPSKLGTPFVAVIHPGGHMVPAEAPELFVKFFKEHAKKE
jgi:polyhydroxybutyrate depolymerase